MFGLTNGISATSHTPLGGTPPVLATRHFRKMRRGSQASLIECDDGALYVLKMAGNPLEPNRLANEFLGTVLCEAVGIPVPVIKPIVVTKAFLAQSPMLTFEESPASYAPTPGLHFGSRFLGERDDTSRLYELLAPSHTLRVTNRDRFLGMYLLDVATNHQGRRQVLFFRDGDVFNLRAFFIDHGQMFGGPCWDKLGKACSPLCRNKAMYLGLWDDANVAIWIANLRKQVPSTLLKAIDHVPANWLTGDIRQVTETISARLEHLPELAYEYHLSEYARLTPSFTDPARHSLHTSLWSKGA